MPERECTQLCATLSARGRPALHDLAKLAIIGSRGFPSTYGGYETLVRYLARHMVRAGHEVTVYCRARDENRRIWITEGVRCVATPGRDTKTLSTLSFGLTSIADASFRRFDAALVLNIANGFWVPALRAARIPFAVNTDGIEWEREKWNAAGKAAFKAGAHMTAKTAPALVCDSEAIGAIWKDLFGRSSVFIPYGGDVVETPGRDRLDAVGFDDTPYILVVARLAPENNVELTLDAVERLNGERMKTVIVGSANFDSPIEHRLKALAKSGAVTWLGHVDDQRLLTQLWANSAAYIHGHSVGGTNPALLQALGAGAPTLALDTPYSREVLSADDQLFPHDAEALAERIRGVIQDANLQEVMRKRGRKIIQERYTWQDVCERYTDLLVTLAEGRPVPL